MTRSERGHRVLLAVFGIVLTVWTVLLFFQGAYFGALFYGVPVPSWAAWVGQLPIWTFNVIDTIAVAALLATLLITRYDGHHRSRRMGSRGSAVATALLLILVVAVLIALGFTFQSFVTGVRHFFGF